MTDKNDDRSKEVERINEGKLGAEDLNKLQTKLLEEIRNLIPKSHFEWWFDEKLSIEKLNKGNQIIFGTDSELLAAWMQLRYSNMLKKMLKSITDDVDYEISFVVRESCANNFVHEGNNTAYNFLFEKENNTYDEEYADYIEEKLKSDNGESELTIVQCVMCGCDNVPNVGLDIDLKSRNERIKSIKIVGSKCSNCGEAFINGRELRVIEMIEKSLQSEDRASSIEAMRDDD